LVFAKEEEEEERPMEVGRERLGDDMCESI